MSELERHYPDWRSDVTGMCVAVVMAVAEDANPLPWPAGFVSELESNATKFATHIFERYTHDRVILFEIAQFVKSEIQRLTGAVNDMARGEQSRRAYRTALAFDGMARSGEALN